MKMSVKNVPKPFHQMSQEGFTLIELLVVVSIISFIASILLVQFHTTGIKGRDIRRTADIAQISKALNLYYQDHGKFPCKAHFDTSTNPNFLQPLVDGGYLATNPKDPDNVTYWYDYFTFHKTPNDNTKADCGQYAFLAFYTEGMATCPTGGAYSNSDAHCHVLIPEPLPSPCQTGPNVTNPYDLDGQPQCTKLWDTHSANDDY
jgi:prepilin-type N-terminal cleavage/methylation domain-containing protein